MPEADEEGTRFAPVVPAMTPLVVLLAGDARGYRGTVRLLWSALDPDPVALRTLMQRDGMCCRR